MKTCDNCGGVLDDKGKCVACGKVSEMRLSGDGESSNELPEYISRIITSGGKLPGEQFYIDGCKHCVDAYGLWIKCDLRGDPVEHYNICCDYCTAKEKR